MVATLSLVMVFGLELDNGMGESALPKSAEFLKQSQVLFRLERLCPRSEVEKYKSWIDYLLCEFFPEHRLRCRTYYWGYGSKLIDRASPDELVFYDESLHRILKEINEISPHWFRSVTWEMLRSCARTFYSRHSA